MPFFPVATVNRNQRQRDAAARRREAEVKKQREAELAAPLLSDGGAQKSGGQRGRRNAVAFLTALPTVPELSEPERPPEKHGNACCVIS